MVHNLLPNNNKLFKFGLRENDTCTFCTHSDNKSHLWLCTQATGLGMIVRAILEEHSDQKRKCPGIASADWRLTCPNSTPFKPWCWLQRWDHTFPLIEPERSSRNQR